MTQPAAPLASGRRWDFFLSLLSCAIAVAIYGAIAGTTDSETSGAAAADAYYNRLVDGFRQGKLSLAQDVPPGLAALSNPYDLAANAPYHGLPFSRGRVHDLSYFHGRLYLYFSVVPAVVLFLPYRLVTGAYLSHQLACAVFSGLALIAVAALLRRIRSRCFPAVGGVPVALAILGVGLPPMVPPILARADVWEVPIISAYAFTVGALLCLWMSWERGPRAWLWVGGMSICVGLAIGSRPTLFLVGSLLLFPLARVVQSYRSTGAEDRRSATKTGMAAVGPFGLIAVALLWYNYQRFGHALDFGQRYQLRQDVMPFDGIFTAKYALYNFRVYFLESWTWVRDFPFTLQPDIPQIGAHGFVEGFAGLIPCVPFVLLAGAVPSTLPRDPAARRSLVGLALTVLLLAVGASVLYCCFYGVCLRYEMEFATGWVLLAAIGFLGLHARFQGPGWPRMAMRVGSSGLLLFSATFNLLATVELRGRMEELQGLLASAQGRTSEAVGHLNKAIALRPGGAGARNLLGVIYFQERRLPEALAEFAQAVKADPRSMLIRMNFARCLLAANRLPDAERETRAALALSPQDQGATELLRKIREAMKALPPRTT